MINKLVLGTVQFGLNYGINNKIGKISADEVFNILNHAYNSGINLIDTAEGYNDSQELIGRFHKESSFKFDIMTKHDSSNTLFSNIIQRIEYNLKVLNVDGLYSYMFHSYSDFSKYFSTYENELLLLKENGKIKKIGVSLYTNSEIEEVIKYESIDLIQLPFNLLDNDSLRGKLLKIVKSKNIEIHIRSIFLQGLFFKNINTFPKYLEPLKKHIKNLNDICTNDFTIKDLALNYVANKNYIDKIIIGVDSLDQLKSNLNFNPNNFSERYLQEIEKIQIEDMELLNPSNWN